MIPYQTKEKRLSGTTLKDVWRKAKIIWLNVKKKTKRKAYIKSAYFNKQKIFFDFFWIHLAQINPYQRMIRLKYFPCAMDLIKNSRNIPISKINPNKKTEVLHRFAGLTKQKELFYVQIKENLKTDRKYFMSVFPKR